MNNHLPFDRAGIIIINNGALLLLHRIKNDCTFYAVPGGCIEENESPEIAAVRELKEETGLDVVLGQRFIELTNQGRKETYFLAESWQGNPELGGEELERNCPKNQYTLQWVDCKKLNTLQLYPEALHQALLNYLQ